MSAPVRVRELEDGTSLRPFIDVAWRINAGDPVWVPPLRAQLRTLLDRRKHPFHRHAETAYFLAERHGRAVGRIAAIVNHGHNDFHDERTGFFGFFECERPPETAEALLSAAAGWLRDRGMERLRGPMNFSTNEECGLLVEGFDEPPAFMMPHNPPWYADLLEDTGLRASKDLLAYQLDKAPAPERLVRGVERIARREGATVRPLRMKRFSEDVGIIKDIYNSAWSRNWGFVPMTDAEFDFMAREVKPVVDPDLCLIAEVAGEPVGFSLALPDLNPAIKPLGGRLFPFGYVRLLWNRRKIWRVRIITLGLKPGYRNRGIGALLYLRTWRVGADEKGYHGEASWILEDNREMRLPLEKMGAYVSKRYRIFERPLSSGP